MKYYAEYLSNINFVGVYLDTDFDPEKPMTIDTEQGTSMASVTVDGELRETLRLPAIVSRKKIVTSTSATSTKLPVLESLKMAQPVLSLPPTCICESPLTGSDVKWKRLPSEHWAELMDLWHCHKPSEPTKNGNSLYDLAMNGFHATPGQAFFSDTYFLVHQADFDAAPHSKNCPLAKNDKISNKGKSIKFWKWDLDTGPVGRVISEILVELIDAHAVYTYEVNKELLIWVFNPSVVYTAQGTELPARGCKVFYGPATELKLQRPDAEVVDIPDPVYEKLLLELAASNASLPSSVQSMGKWRLAVI